MNTSLLNRRFCYKIYIIFFEMGQCFEWCGIKID